MWPYFTPDPPRGYQHLYVFHFCLCPALCAELQWCTHHGIDTPGRIINIFCGKLLLFSSILTFCACTNPPFYYFDHVSRQYVHFIPRSDTRSRHHRH